MRLGVDAAGDEALDLSALLVEHADRRVPRAGQLAGGLQQLVQDVIELEMGHERPPGLQEPPQLGLVEDALGHGPH